MLWTQGNRVIRKMNPLLLQLASRAPLRTGMLWTQGNLPVLAGVNGAAAIYTIRK